VRIGLVVPGFSADSDDWCIPALRHLVVRLAGAADVHIFALRYPDHRGSYGVFGAQVTALGGGDATAGRSARLWQRAASVIVAEHRRRPFDALHAFWAGEPGFVTALLGRVLGIPTVVSIAGGELARLRDIGYGGLLRRLERVKTRLALRLAGAVTAGSALALESALPFLPAHRASRARRVPLGVDLAMFAPGNAPRSGSRTRILHVASLSGVKDQATLLSAAAALRDRGYAFQLDLVGTGPLEPELRSLARCLGLSENVCWRGAVPHDQMPRAYQRADLFVMSSRHEAQGMVALEAAACAVPVVGTAVGVIPELRPDARTIGVGDAGGLADAMAELVEDKPSRLRSGFAARERAVAEYGVELCTARFLDLYRELGAASGGGHA
jgi:glycosyltransferase involved in cell wall biosynthesis